MAGGRSAVVAAGSGARAAIGELGEPPCQGQRHALSLLAQGHSYEPYRAYAHRTARGDHTIQTKKEPIRRRNVRQTSQRNSLRALFLLTSSVHNGYVITLFTWCVETMIYQRPTTRSCAYVRVSLCVIKSRRQEEERRGKDETRLDAARRGET